MRYFVTAWALCWLCVSALAQNPPASAEPPPLVGILQNALIFKKAGVDLDARIRTISEYHTTVLGRSLVPNWSPKHEKWPAVNDRIRADLQAHAAELASAWDPLRAQEAYRAAINSQLAASDVAELQRFASTELGARYARFMRELDRALCCGSIHFNSDGEPVVESHVPAEKRRQYFRLAHLSHQYQSLVAIHGDPGATQWERARYDARDQALETTFDTGAARFDGLLETYEQDLPAFEAYSRSDVAQHTFKAMAVVDRDVLKYSTYWGNDALDRLVASLLPGWKEHVAAILKPE